MKPPNMEDTLVDFFESQQAADGDIDFFAWSVGEDGSDVVALGIRYVEPTGPSVYVAVLLAALTHYWGVDYWHHLGDVFLQQSIKQSFVSILQADEIDVAFEIGVLSLVAPVRARELFFSRGNVRRHQPKQSKLAAFLFGERAALVEQGILEQ